MTPLQPLNGFAGILASLILFGCTVESLWRRENSVVRRWIPFQRRKPVPWQGWELFLIFVLFLLLTGISSAVCVKMQFGNSIRETPLTEEQTQELLKEHTITRLIVSGRDAPSVFLLVVLSGVIIVPIGEEFLFRLLLQGFAEKREAEARRLFPNRFLRPFFRGSLSVLFSSVIFAGVHLRSTTESGSFQKYYDLLLGMMLGHLLLLVFALLYLIVVRGASLADLGIEGRKIPGDCLLGVLASVVILPPVYLMNYGVINLIGDRGIALDPIPLFLFAVGLGVLYYRTHRVVPGLVVHGLFNAVAVATVYQHAARYY